MHESAELGKDFSLTDVLAVLPDRVVERATIVVRDGRIDRVGTAGPTSGRVVGCDGAVAVPGLLDPHGSSTDWIGVRDAGVTTRLHPIDFSHPNRTGDATDAVLCDPAHPAATDHVDVRPLIRLDLDDPTACVRAIECVRTCHDPAAPIVVSLEDRDEAVAERRLGDDDPLHWFTIHAVARRLRLAARSPVTADDVDRAVEWGASLAEFPVTIEAARRARERGLRVIVDADADTATGRQRTVGAEALVELGLADGIAAVDRPESLLAAVSQFVLRGVCDLQTAVRLVTSGSAEAYGMIDRGRLAAGQRADITLLSARGERFVVERTIRAAGRRSCVDSGRSAIGGIQSSA